MEVFNKRLYPLGFVLQQQHVQAAFKVVRCETVFSGKMEYYDSVFEGGLTDT